MSSAAKNLSRNINSIPFATVKQVVQPGVTMPLNLSNISDVNKVLNCVNGAFEWLYFILIASYVVKLLERCQLHLNSLVSADRDR